jgi:acyl-CoA synthetase (AMP-forming)/AMP-acid ligase II
MIYLLWLLMFGVFGATGFVLTAFFSGAQTQVCVLFMVLLLVAGWITAEFIDEVESKKC